MDPVKKLSNIINASLQENSLDKLNEYLASLKNSEEFFNGKLMLVLIKILKKHGKHEEKTLHVYCVLTCLEYFVNTVPDPQKWEKVSDDISKICELVFVISFSFIKEDTVVQRVVDVISAIADGVDNAVDNLLKFMLKTLLAASLGSTHTKYTRLTIMILISSLLQKSSRGTRTEILPSTIDNLNDLSNFLSESDDYETQVSVVEVLARSLIFIHQKHRKLFTSNTKLGEMFKKYEPFLRFDPDCRRFLNEVNESLGDQQKVFSVPCMVVSADESRLKKPNDPAYSDFWVDFNLGSKSVSFYYQLSNSESWELMTVPQNKVISAVAKESACQSRNGEKFDAVKFELTIDSSNLSPNSELPQKLKIYPGRDKFIKIEPVIQKIFNEKYKFEVAHNEKANEKMLGNKSSEDTGTHKLNETCREQSFIETRTPSKFEVAHNEKANEKMLGNKSSEDTGTHKLNETCREQSFIETRTPSKFPDDEQEREEEDDKYPDKSKAKSSLSSEEADEEVSEEGSPYSRYIKEKMLGKGKSCVVASSSQEDLGDEIINNIEKTNTNRELDLPEHETKSAIEDINSNLPQNVDGGIGGDMSNECCKSSSRSSSSVKSLDKGLKGDEGGKQTRDSDPKKGKDKLGENTSQLNSNSKKKRLYCFEKSNAEDVVMSSQDQVLSVEIPSYKITKKETFTKPQPNVNRKNISYSYITNKKKENSEVYTKYGQQKQFNFEEATETQKSLSNDGSSENGGESPPQIFKDTLTKTKASSKIEANKKFFSKKRKNEVELGKNIESPHKKFSYPKSAYSDFSSPEKRERLKCINTYGRIKQQKTWKRNKAMTIELSDSDSHSEYIPPSKVLKVDNEEINKLSPKKTRLTARVVKDEIDPIRGNVFTNEMELEAAHDFEEPALQPREIVAESLITQGKMARKISVNVVQRKNTNTGRKKATKQINSKCKKPELKKPKQDILKTISENLTGCMDVVHYEPPENNSPLGCEDLELDILSCNDDQQKKILLHTTFKINDMVRFGKLLLKQVQEKLLKDEKLAKKEREMNLATFDYKIQASCNGLYGNCQKLESVTDKLEKLDTMLQTTYKLHKEIAAQINSEALKIEEAKNDLMKNINKIDKTKSSSISSIFQGFGGYVKKLVLSFIQGNTTKSAITN